jgi:hypothetical protein
MPYLTTSDEKVRIQEKHLSRSGKLLAEIIFFIVVSDCNSSYNSGNCRDREAWSISMGKV